MEVKKLKSGVVSIPRNTYKMLVEKYEGKKPFGRRTGRWEDNIIMNLNETRFETPAWIQLAQDRGQWRILVNTVVNLRSSIKGNQFLDQLSYY
jgi:hypothetical protein